MVTSTRIKCLEAAIPFCHRNNKIRISKLIAGDKLIYPGDRKIVNPEFDGASLANSQNEGCTKAQAAWGSTNLLDLFGKVVLRPVFLGVYLPHLINTYAL